MLVNFKTFFQHTNNNSHTIYTNYVVSVHNADIFTLYYLSTSRLDFACLLIIWLITKQMNLVAMDLAESNSLVQQLFFRTLHTDNTSGRLNSSYEQMMVNRGLRRLWIIVLHYHKSFADSPQ